MVGKTFAPEYERTPEGWVLFPTDAEYRKRMFPPEVREHVAKANVYLIQAIVEYVSEPEETVLDIMAGTGTILTAALIGRSVIAIEISERYFSLMQQAVEKLEAIAPGISGAISLINSPCQRVLPMPNTADHIVFSPQYASIMKSKGTDKFSVEQGYSHLAEYSKDPMNLGLMNDFMWAAQMEQIYAKCLKSLRQGGTMTLIVKDHMSNRKRVPLTARAVKSCEEVGFKVKEWFKWKAPGSVYTSMYRARGWEVVEEEDIVIFARKGG